MAVSAIVENGTIVDTTSTTTSSSSSSNSLDKDAFLQLLVAQMKYQDPLEPTSNTEYITQYATFTQVEAMQNMSSTMELSRASSMVGQYVQIEYTSSSGTTYTVEGTVDYVTFENNKAYVSVGGTLYLADYVTAVVDSTYQAAYELADAFITALESLPSLSNLTISDEEDVETLREAYNNMTSYQQSFIDDEYVELLKQYVSYMSALVEAASATESDTTQTDEESSETTEAVEETTEEVDATEG